MIDKLIFDDLDPWMSQYNKHHDRRGRFAGKSGGSGIPSRAAGRGSSKGATPRVGGKQMRAIGRTKTTQTVSGVRNGQMRSVKVTSRNRMLRNGTKTYTYKVGKNGIIRKHPSQLATTAANPLGHNRHFRPGSPVGKNKNVRYLTRAHVGTRTVGVGMPLGRLHSAHAVRQMHKGKPVKPGYVVSYGKPLPVSTGN